jgi:hypothetical protein
MAEASTAAFLVPVVLQDAPQYGDAAELGRRHEYESHENGSNK